MTLLTPPQKCSEHHSKLMNSDNFIVQQASSKDEKSIERFFEEALPHRSEYKFPHRWNWLFKDNPFWDSQKGVPCWIAKKGNRVVGMAGIMPCVFEFFQQPHLGGWCIDFRVLEEFRGTGLGKMLQASRQNELSTFSLGMSKISRIVKSKTGQTSGPLHTVYLKVKRFDSSLLLKDILRYLKIEDINNSKWYYFGVRSGAAGLLSIIATLLFNRNSCAKRQAHNTETPDLLTFDKIDNFGPNINVLWDQIKTRYSCAVRRYDEYLNWKYINQPHMNYQCYTVSNNGILCGVIVFRKGESPEPDVGIIAEAYTLLGREAQYLIVEFAVEKLFSMGAKMVQCYSTDELMGGILQDLGFLPIRYEVPMFSIIGEAAGLSEKISKTRWFMSLGDADRDQYPAITHPSVKILIDLIKGKIEGEELIYRES